MTENITITAEQVEKMLKLRECAERRLDRAIKNSSSHEDEYRAECIAIERMLDIMGVEWTVTWDPLA